MTRYSKFIKEVETVSREALTAEEWNLTFSKDIDNDLYHRLSIFLRVYSNQIKNTHKILSNYVIVDNIKEVPFFYYHKEKKKVVLFRNIFLFDKISKSSSGADIIGDTCIFINKWLLDDIITDAKRKDTKEVLDKVWGTPILARNKLFKKETTTLESFIAKYINKMPKENTNALIDALKPIEVIIGKSVEDWINVYMQGPKSCMHPTSEYSKNWLWMTKKKTGFRHPSEFYSYVPGLSVAYVQGASGITARAILYDKKGEKAKGKIYTDGTKGLRDKVHYALSQMGYNSDLNDDQWECNEDWEVPGEYIDHLKDYICPIPYTDNIKLPLSVGFHISTKTFRFSFNKNKYEMPLDLRVNTGFITAKSILTPSVCKICSAKIKAGKGITTKDGNLFCSDVCCFLAGYVVSQEADGNVAWNRRDQCIQDNLRHGVWYTSEYAALKAGCSRFIVSFDPLIWTVTGQINGTNVAYKGDWYTLHETVCDQVYNGRHRSLRINGTANVKINGRVQQLTEIELIPEAERNVEAPQVIDW